MLELFGAAEERVVHDHHPLGGERGAEDERQNEMRWLHERSPSDVTGTGPGKVHSARAETGSQRGSATASGVSTKPLSMNAARRSSDVGRRVRGVDDVGEEPALVTDLLQELDVRLVGVEALGALRDEDLVAAAAVAALADIEVAVLGRHRGDALGDRRVLVRHRAERGGDPQLLEEIGPVGGVVDRGAADRGLQIAADVVADVLLLLVPVAAVVPRVARVARARRTSSLMSYSSGCWNTGTSWPSPKVPV